MLQHRNKKQHSCCADTGRQQRKRILYCPRQPLWSKHWLTKGSGDKISFNITEEQWWIPQDFITSLAALNFRLQHNGLLSHLWALGREHKDRCVQASECLLPSILRWAWPATWSPLGCSTHGWCPSGAAAASRSTRLLPWCPAPLALWRGKLPPHLTEEHNKRTQ